MAARSFRNRKLDSYGQVEERARPSGASRRGPDGAQGSALLLTRTMNDQCGQDDDENRGSRSHD